jgi:DNA-binding NarL/FixJ family response regulator
MDFTEGVSARTGVLVVEDELELLRRLADSIASEPSFFLWGAAATGAEALASMANRLPDVVLLDLGLPDIDGIELIRRITKQARDQARKVDVLVFTMFADSERVLASIYAGACGYLLKDGDTSAIVASIHEVLAGGSPITPTIARKILTQLQKGSLPPHTPSAANDDAAELSKRETEVLRLVSKGLSFDEVGAQMDISTHTVVAHIKKIYRKLAVHSRSEAVYEAGQRGLL